MSAKEYLKTKFSAFLPLYIIIVFIVVIAPFLMSKVFIDSEYKAPCKDGSNNIVDSTVNHVTPPETVTVYITSNGSSVNVPFEEYIKCVVAGEMPSSFHSEALKAQAVAARTYSVSKIISAHSGSNPTEHPSAPLCDSTHCQVYKSVSQLKKIKDSSWMSKDWKKICDAVDSTRGQLLYYQGNLVKQALFHSSSGGNTENSQDVFSSSYPYPYLVSVSSPYEYTATHKNEKNTFSLTYFIRTLQAKYQSTNFGIVTSENIKITQRSQGGNVTEMQVGSAKIKGTSIRDVFKLPSTNFTIAFDGSNIVFTSSGYGHGVGMSQYGANGMANEGYNYKQILRHYYSGTKIE